MAASTVLALSGCVSVHFGSRDDFHEDGTATNSGNTEMLLNAATDIRMTHSRWNDDEHDWTIQADGRNIGNTYVGGDRHTVDLRVAASVQGVPTFTTIATAVLGDGDPRKSLSLTVGDDPKYPTATLRGTSAKLVMKDGTHMVGTYTSVEHSLKQAGSIKGANGKRSWSISGKPDDVVLRQEASSKISSKMVVWLVVATANAKELPSDATASEAPTS